MPQQRPKEDVLVHYDEKSRELVFHTVPTSSTSDIRKRAFGGVRPSVDKLRDLAGSEALRKIGRTVAGLLDLSAEEKLDLARDVPPPNDGEGVD